ncbi:YeeE/YedE [Achromobacter sp. HZ01]|uniref:YeeE/YedE family protein n=1 Tax=Achromobacter sp. HZ01 TaxID=1416886 RepID=UPI000DC1FBE6|nr:YeeE/YedE family protein [Achromobacter sp. HZ01]RAP60949.1 YeeE/YedE [Achromobacter sp. HZ01]
MTLDWPAFTPVASTLGGLLIGAAAVLMMGGAGRIAGISGILGGLLGPAGAGRSWRLAFLAGLFAAPWLYRLGAALPAIAVEAGTARLIAAGLLVGLGTRYASGCTSGHGVCGISRGSPRSLAATALFMAAGFVTVYALRHLGGS